MTAVNVAVFVAILIVLVILHELGHMVVAKLCGMRVERFSVFFGRPIWSVTKGETEYGIGWLPLGGYVKITGMAREELVERVRDPESGQVIQEIPLPPEVQARAYCNSTTPRKVATILAGPAANVVVAVIAFTISFWSGITVGVDGQTNVIGRSDPGTPAHLAGLREGDRIVAINGVSARGDDPKPFLAQIQNNIGEPITVTYERDGRSLTTRATPVPDQTDPTIGRLRFSFEQRTEFVEHGFPDAVAEAVDFTGYVTKAQVQALGRLFVDEQTRSQVSSVVGIGATYNNIAGEGFGTVMRFIGLLSLILAIMNLIPLLPLDGGHIVFALAERIRGKRMDIAVYQRASMIGIALVGILFIYALNNDFARLFGEGFNP
jgi:regulator of sigma E protease